MAPRFRRAAQVKTTWAMTRCSSPGCMDPATQSRFFFFILIHPQVTLLARQLQGFFCLCVFQFLYLFNDLILQSFTRSVLHSEPTIDRILKIFLVYCSALVFPDFCLDIFFPNRLSLSAAPPIWPSWQYIVLLLAKILRKSFGHSRSLLAGQLAWWKYTLLPIFPTVRCTFSDAHYSHHHCLADISAFLLAKSSRKRCLRLRRSSIADPAGLLPPWMKANFAAATAFSRSSSGHGGAFAIDSLILNTMPLVLPTLLLCARSFPDSPTIFFCLPLSGPVSLMCRRAGKYCCLFLLSASVRTSERPPDFLA